MKHLRDTAAISKLAVCGVRPQVLTNSVTELLSSQNPCSKCLEWVVEQGQIASRRLAETKEPSL